MNSRLWLVLCILSSMLFSHSAVAKFTPEQVKAVYVYRIASFVFWNSDEQMSDIKICAPDDEQVRTILIDITKDKAIRNKPLHISDTDCDVIYITKKANLGLIKKDKAHAISISDINRFTELGGVVELATLGGRIKPKVNLDNIGQYKLSANFLRVADIVGGKK